MTATFSPRGLSRENFVQLTELSDCDHVVEAGIVARWKKCVVYETIVCVALGILSCVLLIYVLSLHSNSNLFNLNKDSNVNYAPNWWGFQSASNGDYVRTFKYPLVRRDLGIFDIYHGVKVNDPYRWLESNSTETEEFIKDQNELTNSFLRASRLSQKIRDRMTHQLENVWETPWHSTPYKIGDKYFVFYYEQIKQTKESNSVVYGSKYTFRHKLDDQDRVILDETKEGIEPTSHVTDTAHSSNGDIFAYLYSREKIVEWNQANDFVIKFRNVSTATDLPDSLTTAYAILWSTLHFSKEDRGLYYIRQEIKEGSNLERNSTFTVFHHRLGTDQIEDTIVTQFTVAETIESYTIFAYSHCGRYLIGCVYGRSYLVSLERQRDLIPLVDFKPETSYTYLTNEDQIFYFHERGQDSKGKILKIDAGPLLANSDKARLPSLPPSTDLIKDDSSAVLRIVGVIDKDKLVLIYQRYSMMWLELRKLQDGSLIQKLTDFPAGFVQHWNCGWENNECFFSHGSLLADSVYHCQLQRDLQCRVFNTTKIHGIDLSSIVHEQFFYQTSNGLQPIDIVRKKDFKMDGTAPVLLQNMPATQATRKGLIFVENFNGVYAIIEPTTNSERAKNEGKALRENDLVEKIQSAAEYLIQNKYTKQSKLAIMGKWAVSACVNQRPDLFGAAIISGETDLLRVGLHCNYCPDFESPTKLDHFEDLLKYSPLHNIRLPEKHDGLQYPSTFVWTIKNDGNLSTQAFKYVAQLQFEIGQTQNGRQMTPLLLRTYPSRDTGSSPEPRALDVYSFLAEAMDLEIKDC